MSDGCVKEFSVKISGRKRMPAEAVVFQAGENLREFLFIGDRVARHDVLACRIARRAMDVLHAVETRLNFECFHLLAAQIARRLRFGRVVEQNALGPFKRFARARSETRWNAGQDCFFVVAEDRELGDAFDDLKTLARLRAVADHVAQTNDVADAEMIDVIEHCAQRLQIAVDV